MSTLRLTVALAACLVAAASPPTQSPPAAGPMTSPAPLDLAGRVGITTGADGLFGAGPGYRARFAPAAFEFTPALGLTAPHDLPISYRLTSVRRDAGQGGVLAARPTPIDPAAPSTPSTVDTAVRYDHGPVTALYELRTDGVEQSFVFDALPPGTGDLVVRGQLTTELMPSTITKDEIAFEAAGIGGVRFGAVIGIDARGRRVRGELRYDDGAIEYVLPAEFVEAAALPLVVDPLIGSIIRVGAGSQDHEPDIAYDAENDLFLIVFRVVLSANDADVYARRWRPATGSVGTLLLIEGSASINSLAPHVANIDASDGFVVVWQQNGDIVARGIAAATGAMTATVSVASGSDVQSQPDVGGEAGPTQTAAVCVWTNETTSDIQARHVIYNAGSLLVGLVVTTFANPVSSPYSHPAISQHHGSSGHRMICWERFVSLGTANRAIVAVVVDRNLATVAGPTLFFNNSVDELDPDCDGDGEEWVIAFEREEALIATTDVFAFPIHRSGSSLVAGAEHAIAWATAIDEIDPSVCWLRESCLIGLSRETAVATGHYDTYVHSLDPFDCTVCEGLYPLRVSNVTAQSATAIASKAGSPNVNEALVVWAANAPLLQLQAIESREFRADDGSVTELAASCGTGGALRAGCPRAGVDFALGLRGAAPASTALLLLSISRIDYLCGSCLLVPDPYVGFVGTVGTTSATGDTAASFVLPVGIGGAGFYAQYVTTNGTCFGGFSLSNAVLVIVQ